MNKPPDVTDAKAAGAMPNEPLGPPPGDKSSGATDPVVAAARAAEEAGKSEAQLRYLRESKLQAARELAERKGGAQTESHGDDVAGSQAQEEEDLGPPAEYLSAWQPFTEEMLLTDPPEQRFILKPYVSENVAMSISGPGGSLKTQLALHLMVCRACRVPWLNGVIPSLGHSVFLTPEDDLDDIKRRLAVERQELGTKYDPKAVAKYVHYMNARRLRLRFIEPKFGTYEVHPSVTWVAETIKQFCSEADFVYVETVNRVCGGDESNAAHGILIEALETISNLLPPRPTIMIAGHVGQEVGRKGVGDQWAQRGGGSLGDNGRSTMVTALLTEGTAKIYAPGSHLTAQELQHLYVLTHPKGNGSVEPAHPLLYERVSHRWGAMPRAANLHVRVGGDGKNVLYERMISFVRERIAAGLVPTKNMLVEQREKLGVKEERTMSGHVDDAVSDKVLIQDLDPDHRTRGGGIPLLPGKLPTSQRKNF